MTILLPDRGLWFPKKPALIRALAFDEEVYERSRNARLALNGNGGPPNGKMSSRRMTGHIIGGPKAKIPVVSFLGSGSSATDGTTYNFTATSVPNNCILVVATHSDGGNGVAGGFTTFNINGSAGNFVCGVQPNLGNPPTDTHIYYQEITTGGSIAVNITYAVSRLRAGRAWWAITNYNSATPFDSSAVQSGSVAIDVPGYGVAIAINTLSGSSAGVTWTNATERYDADIAAESAHQSGADYTRTSGGIEAARSFSTTASHVIAAASWF